MTTYDLPTLRDLLTRVEAATGAMSQLAEVLARRSSFEAKVSRSGEDGCWLWTGSVCSPPSLPYGRFYISKSRIVRSHRAAYMLATGEDPGSMYVCHSCDNPRCCNPRHLWLGTATDNNVDRSNKGRSAPGRASNPGASKPGEMHPQSKLTTVDVIDIRRRGALGEGYRSIAKDYPFMSKSQVHRVLHGNCWRHVKVDPAVVGQSCPPSPSFPRC